MAKGQPVTKEEMSVILKEAFGGFREEMKGEIAKSSVEMRKEVVQILHKEMVPILLDFHDKVQIPMMDEVLTRLGKVESAVEDTRIELKNEIGRLERKLDQVTDHQAIMLDNHESRIGKIEATL